MAPISAPSKPSISTRKTKVDGHSSLLTAVADPSKCDDQLARRLAKSLNITRPPATARNVAKGKQKSAQPGNDVEEKRILAMQAANAASQSLGTVLQSEWKALNPKKASAFSMESVTSIVSTFRIAINFLRELNLGTIEVERVASGFVGKLLAVQLYEPALELLDEIKAHTVRYYHRLAPPSVPKETITRVASRPSFTRYMHLVQYPHPAPQDSTLIALIGTSLGQAMTALSAVMLASPSNDATLEAFISLVEEQDGPISWHSLLPTDHADALLARAHRGLATSFSSSNTSSNMLLRLRTLALRCLLCRVTLDPESFWTQATNYMASHGKSVIKSEDALTAVKDVVTFFDRIVTAAQERRDATAFMSGSAFLKFCEIALVFAKRGDVTSLGTITRFINADNSGSASPGLPEDDFSVAKLYAAFSQGAVMLDKSPGDPGVFDALSRCTEVLPRVVALFSRPELKSKAIHSVERLRRTCCKALDDTTIEDDLKKVVKSLLVKILARLEHRKERQEFTACIIDSLCSLAKFELLPANSATHMTSYEFLQRAVTHIDSDVEETSKGTTHTNVALCQAKVMRVLASAFRTNAVVLYQECRYAAAIRFLVQACGLAGRVCHMLECVGPDTSDVVSDPKDELRSLKSQLPNLWELLGDCYSKVGDRRLAHDAFIECLKRHSFDALCDSAASSSPSQLSSSLAYRRLASVVVRATHIAVFDLLLQGESSLRQTLCALGVGREAVGLILEWQAASLEDNSSRNEARPALTRVLQDALEVYGTEFPMRRARVLLRQLDLAYRMDDLSAPINEIAVDIQELMSQDSGKDAALIAMQPQYKAFVHIWMVFHSHRRSQNNSHSTIILDHATLASRILRGIFPPAQVSHGIKSPKRSPKVTATRAAKPVARASPRKKKTATTNKDPVTPKSRKVNMQTSVNPRMRDTPPNASPPKPLGLTTDSHLITSIQMIAQLMGLLGHVVLKIQFLNILQRMTEHSAGPSTNDFVRASVDAANEYMRLGKTQRAMAIYTHALAAVDCATVATVSDEVRVSLLLHYAEAHALNGNTEKSSTLYEEARNLSQRIESPQFNSTAARIRARVLTLECSALASNVFSVTKVAQDDPHAAFSTLRQSLRLWNRALHTLSRLSVPPAPASPNPFDMNTLAEALPVTSGPSQKEIPQPKVSYRRSTAMDGLQWRIAEGLLHTLFGLGRAYFLQGTVRGAEYFIEQARDLAESLNSPTMLSRALAKIGELQLHQGKLEEAATTLLEASKLLHDMPGIDAANINRLRAHHSQLTNQHMEAKALYAEIMHMLSELEKTLGPMEISFSSSRRSSLTRSPRRSTNIDILAPGFLATVLKQQIWLQRNEPEASTKPLLDQISTLPSSRETRAEELAILAKLALHDAHIQFRTDLFLSSLAESTIALPMGVPSHAASLSPSARHMFETLSAAEKMFWDSLEFVSNRGHVSDVRDAAVSLALIRSFQTSLGKTCNTSARVAAGLLDASAAITLRRELIDDIEQKFPELGADDLVWPTLHGRPNMTQGPLQFDQSMDSNEDTDPENPVLDLKAYWDSVRDRYYSSYDLDEQSVSASQTDLLPAHWTVVSISITEDKSTMFFSRQRHNSEPLIFCIPLERHGRKEENATDQFTYNDAVGQFKDILQEEGVTTEDGKKIPSDDRDAKIAWWAKRATLDRRMRELLENIEFCWLGAFKTILSEPVKMPPDVLNSLRIRFEKVFKRNLASDKKRMSRVKFDDALMECFAALSPKCRDEELEDLVYFVLDLYQFHGVHVALSEVDMDQLTVELRTQLEEHASKTKGRILPLDDPHLFLVLDKNVQGIPWESIPILRGRSVSRIPSLSFLVDRIELVKLQRESLGMPVSSLDRAVVNPKNAFYVLNPSGDLAKSQARFGPWVKEMEAVGWQGIAGQEPSEQKLLDALSKKDLVIYIGHGGAEQYVRSSKIKLLQRCAATMLWGCSSGRMRDMGDFDRIGTPYNYMLAGCPTLVACLWDVTDNELDKVSRSVFDKLRLDADHVKAWSSERMDEAPMSLVAAVGQSRDACKLKYLTGAAPVVYGIPFYL